VWLSTPILFCIVALFLCTTPFIEAPIESAIALGIVLIAIPIWFVYVKFGSFFSKCWNCKLIGREKELQKHVNNNIVFFLLDITSKFGKSRRNQGYQGMEMTETE
jgi:hypothetical protein